MYCRLCIKHLWFGDIRMQLCRLAGLGTRYIIKLIRHVVSSHPLRAVYITNGAVTVNINAQLLIYFLVVNTTVNVQHSM